MSVCATQEGKREDRNHLKDGATGDGNPVTEVRVGAQFLPQTMVKGPL